MTELNPRRQAILAVVVQEYIATAQPVGSKTVVEEYGLRVSSATIRNEMRVLEDHGYLTHPHTSAGRVPTGEGYRYFVEHLLPEHPLSVDDQLMIQHQFHQVGQESDQWAQLAAAILAHTARMAALATPVKAESCRFKHVELVEVRDGLVLLVLVLYNGIVKQQMLTVDRAITQDELSAVSNQLNDLLSGKRTTQVLYQEIHDVPALGQQILEVIQQIMQREDSASNEIMYREGLSHILVQPEFANTEDAQQLVSVLEQTPLLAGIFESMRQGEGVQVLIGGEGRYEPLRDVSLVLSRYGVSQTATGILGLLGPVRMPYDRAIPLVRYVAQLMSGLVREWYT